MKLTYFELLDLLDSRANKLRLIECINCCGEVTQSGEKRIEEVEEIIVEIKKLISKKEEKNANS
jgi:hypothetical protein